MISYPITVVPDDNDTFLVTCPDLPGMVTFGETEVEAIAMASGALEEFIASRLHDFATIPRPSAGSPRATLSLHTSMILTLFWALHDRGWTRAELQRALGWHRVQVDRLFDPNHETKISRFEAAFRALGFQPEVTASAA